MKTDGLMGKYEPTREYNALLQQEIIKDNVVAMFENDVSEFQGFINGMLKLQALIREYRERNTEEARQFAKELENYFEDIARRKLLNCYFVYFRLGEQDKDLTIVYVFENVDESVDYVKRITGKYLGAKEFYDFAQFSDGTWKNIDNYHYDGEILYFYD